ncbi:MAG: PAS domain-containing protein [Sphingobacteriia bacterium]|nr:PAS domain-containing protein [Sphingobacteriia bacterium]NCC38930.1 PAS domain-containing protein [Gammaproteobacteria bacterium]
MAAARQRVPRLDMDRGAPRPMNTPPPSDDLLRHPASGLLFDSLPLGIVIQSPAGEITGANPAAETILGLTLDQMRGITSMDPRCLQPRGRVSGDAGHHPGYHRAQAGRDRPEPPQCAAAA